MSVHSRPSIQYQDGMELRDRKMTKDCTQPLRIGNIRALNGLNKTERCRFSYLFLLKIILLPILPHGEIFSLICFLS